MAILAVEDSMAHKATFIGDCYSGGDDYVVLADVVNDSSRSCFDELKTYLEAGLT